MRILIFCLGFVVLGLRSILAQGTADFNTRVQGAVDAPVFGVDGQPLSGPGYTAQLFGGATNSPDAALQPLLPTTTFRLPPGEGYVVVPTETVRVPGVPAGSQARLQLRVWENRGGTIAQWSQVVADPSIARGASPSFLTGRLGGLFVLPANLKGLQSFHLALPSALILHPSKQLDPAFSFRISFSGEAGLTYQIQRTTDLQTWQSVGYATNGPGSLFEFSDLSPDLPNAFYRAEAFSTPGAAKP